MTEQRFPQHSHLKALLFDREIDAKQCIIQVQCDHLAKGTPNRGIYKPTINYEVIDKKQDKFRLKISWEAEFYFNVNKNINEGDLFGCLKFIANDMENFALKNKEQIGEVKVQLEENQNMMRELHKVLQILYNNRSEE